MDNKKIKNAKITEYNGIKFKSNTEVTIYKTLLQYGFKPKYEPTKYIIWEGCKPTIPFYKPSKQGNLEINNTKLINITYTPDFVFLAPDNDTFIIMEIKGHESDTYPIKEKMFRKVLEKLKEKEGINTMFFKIKTKKQCLEAIEIINNTFKNE